MNIPVQGSSYKQAKNLPMHMHCAAIDTQTRILSFLILLDQISPSEFFLPLTSCLNLSLSTVGLPTTLYLFNTTTYVKYFGIAT